MDSGQITGKGSSDAPASQDHASEFPQSNCCYSHDWPYFKEPVPPYDPSTEWDLEEEWNKRMSRDAGRSSVTGAGDGAGGILPP